MAGYFTNDDQYDGGYTLVGSSNNDNFDDRTPNANNDGVQSNSRSRNNNSDSSYDRSNSSSSKGNRDYISGSRDLQETIGEIEKILTYYRRDLRNDKNTQIDCCRQLVTRLADSIRPAYTSHRKKMQDFNELIEQISILHDKRLLDEKEKTKQFRDEILRLETFIIQSTNQNNPNGNASKKNSTNDHQEWLQIEEDTKRLQKIIEHQRDQINELIAILSPSKNIPFVPTVITPDQYPYNPLQTNINDPQFVTARTSPSVYQPPNSGTNIRHSTKIGFSVFDNEIRPEQQRMPTNLNLLPLSSRTSCTSDRKCPVCDFQFHPTANEFEIITHVDKCMVSAGMDHFVAYSGPVQYTCPKCNLQFLYNDEMTYRVHLAECYNRP